MKANKNCQVRLEKTSTLPKHEDIILNFMTQTREKWDYHVLSIPKFYIIWTNVTNDIWMSATSVTVTIIFRKRLTESYLITAMFKLLSHQLRATLAAAFWKTSDIWRFYGHRLTYVLNVRCLHNLVPKNYQLYKN